MGQKEVYEFLSERKGHLFKTEDIANYFNINVSSVSHSLSKLLKSKLIVIETDGRCCSYGVK